MNSHLERSGTSSLPRHRGPWATFCSSIDSAGRLFIPTHTPFRPPTLADQSWSEEDINLSRMASSQARQERGYHQDYIARIRYSNALPPPPIPPKLLDIPNTGLSGGGYTSASFASRLARDQPLNIEADAELGMAIDLVGIPGVFEGNESGEKPPALGLTR